MKKKIIISVILISAFFGCIAQGLELQFVPGVQLGYNKVSYSKNTSENYSYGASLPLMEFDHVGRRLYFNVAMSDLYYSLTSINRRAKMMRDSSKYAKNNGQLIGLRLGWVFGRNEIQRIGFSFNGSWSASNVTKSFDTYNNVSYATFGGGLVYYRQITSKIRTSIKGGFELIKGGKYKSNGSLIYVEPAVSYEIFQRYGFCIQPVVYLRNLDYTRTDLSDSPVFPATKVTQFALKIGFSKSIN
ncbi:MAG: hypothetical protein ACK5D5_03925 [Bacteroidota bacterium]|jgi:hypothetical protein